MKVQMTATHNGTKTEITKEVPYIVERENETVIYSINRQRYFPKFAAAVAEQVVGSDWIAYYVWLAHNVTELGERDLNAPTVEVYVDDGTGEGIAHVRLFKPQD